MRRLAALTLAAAALWAAEGPGDKPNGRISGLVRSATTGEPLKSVLTSLRLSSANTKFTRTAMSGPGGGFAFLGLPEGEYELTLRKSGYRTLTAVTARPNSHTGPDRSDPVFQLQPTGAVSGRVLDSEGEPVPEARVKVYALGYGETGAWVGVAARSESNDLGEYRVHSLPAGKYLVQVQPPRPGTPAGEFYAGTAAVYYPRTSAPSQALPVTVGWGHEVSGIDLELSRKAAYSVSGSVWDQTEGEPCFGCQVSAHQIDDGLVVDLPERTIVSPEGLFELHGLSPGDYKILVRHLDIDDRTAQRRVAITNRSLENIAITLGPGQPVWGEIVLEDPPDGVEPTDWTVYFSSVLLPSWAPDAEAEVEATSQFRLEGVPAETYRFEILGLPSGAYLKALQLAGQRLPALELEVFEHTPLLGVQAVIAFDGATITGHVRQGRSQSAGGGPIKARVALIPNPNQAAHLKAATAETMPDGSFSFDSVPPGAYTLYAAPSTNTVQLMDPAVQNALQSFARAVDLDPMQSVTVELPLAPTAN